MTDQPAPDAAATPARAGGLDGFLILQAVVVVMLGALGAAFVCVGDPHDAGLIATGLLGALAISRKPGAAQ